MSAPGQPAVTGRAGSQRPSQAAADEQPAADDTSSAQAPAQATAAPARKLTGRARRRATSAAGAAQHVDAPAVAPTATVSASDAPVADKPVTEESAAPVAVAAEPVKPQRKKRARVVAPAGPPAAEPGSDES